MGVGALQTRATCWFFSIINGFLLSEAGRKILFASLEKFYKGLTAVEKQQFDDGVPPPCVQDLITTKRIYFYKFLDQYLCFRSGPRSVSHQTGKSANILGGMNLAGSLARNHHGSKGAFSAEELPKVLQHLGVTDYLIANMNGKLPSVSIQKRPHFVICKPDDRVFFDRLPTFRTKTYSRMCCSITFGNHFDKTNLYHAITGYVCNGKGYLFDSNFNVSHECRWWIMERLHVVINEKIVPKYPSLVGKLNYVSYNFVIFSRNSYINSIHPTCKLRYKRTAVNNGIRFRYGNSNFMNKLNTGEFGNLNPAQVAAIKHHRGKYMKRTVIGKNYFNSVTKNKLKNLSVNLNILEKKGYRINASARNNFRRKMKGTPSLTNAAEALYESTIRKMAAEKSKAGRVRVYSAVYKQLPIHTRKLLQRFRDRGTPNSPNLPMPLPITSPRTNRRKVIESSFGAYWNSLNNNNHNTVRNFIAARNKPKLAFLDKEFFNKLLSNSTSMITTQRHLRSLLNKGHEMNANTFQNFAAKLVRKFNP